MFLMMRFYEFCKNVGIPLRFKGFMQIRVSKKSGLGPPGGQKIANPL